MSCSENSKTARRTGFHRAAVALLSLALLSPSGCKKQKAESPPGGSSGAGEGGGSDSLEQKTKKLDYGSLPSIIKLDGPGLMDYRKRTGITICGIRPIALMLETLKQWGRPLDVKVLDYYTSGHVTKDWRNTVSYFSIGFFLKKGSAAPAPPSPRKDSGVATKPGEQSAGKVSVRRMGTGPGWYAKTASRLRKDVKGYLANAKPPDPPGRLVALISPHAGLRFSGKAAAHGYKLAGRLEGLERVVVIGLSHRVPYRGMSVAQATHYETPFGRIPVDLKAVASLRGKPHFTTVESAHLREHSLEMQLPFLHHVKPLFRLVPMLTGVIGANDLAAAARPLVPLLDRRTLLVASSDFAHRGPNFGYQPFSGSGGRK
jgi:predicted class III extradiol MEMO1 family dioxygenase